jgi:ADP-L-glycero-D-manno-heptose 6-epimerase
MKILVTGDRGFIGGHLARSLSADGHEVVTYEWGEPRFTLSGIEKVCHIGAISATTERDVEKVMRQNYDFSCELLDRCMTAGIDFQYSSSASVYGLNLEFKESSPVDPRTPYAWSKYMFERYAAGRQAYADYNGYTIQGFRYFNVYGPEGEEHKGSQASPFQQFKSQAQATGEIRLFENSDQYLRDFVHVSEVVAAHKRFFQVKESGVWNVGTGQPRSFASVAEHVAQDYLAKIIEIAMPDVLKSSYQSYTCADMTKFNNTLKAHNVPNRL